MMKLLIPILFTAAALTLFAAALYFAKYKKRTTGCCGAHDACEHYPDNKDAD